MFRCTFGHRQGDERADLVQQQLRHRHTQTAKAGAHFQPFGFGEAKIDDARAGFGGQFVDAHAFEDFVDGETVVTAAVRLADDDLVSSVYQNSTTALRHSYEVITPGR